MAIVYLILLLFLAKIVLIDSPVGHALGDAIRNLAPRRADYGPVSRGEIEGLRRDVEELRDRLDRVIEEQLFLNELMSGSRRLNPAPGEIEDLD
jgi:hypothetical protein